MNGPSQSLGGRLVKKISRVPFDDRLSLRVTSDKSSPVLSNLSDKDKEVPLAVASYKRPHRTTEKSLTPGGEGNKSFEQGT